MRKVNALWLWILAIAIVCALCALVGCSPTKVKHQLVESELLVEDGMVADLCYAPALHGSGTGVGPTLNMSGDGGVGLAISIVSIDVPEEYAIVFRCQHGKFVINCYNRERRELWRQLNEGDRVQIYYTELWRVETTIDRKTKEVLKVDKALKQYKFKTATVVK